MTLREARDRASGYLRRVAASALFRDPVRMCNEGPLISFSFDDFPRSAYENGGGILVAHGFRGTYYAALGLVGRTSPCGEIFSRRTLVDLVSDGHELGCHTYGHCHAWRTEPKAFKDSIVANDRCLKAWLPAVGFRTFAYPISTPDPRNKQSATQYYPCCRLGGQAYNVGVVDRGLLAAFFIERSRHDPESLWRTIDQNAEAKGWLILATHDVSEAPSQFGCSQRQFEEIVRYAARSGARVLPVGEAWELVSGAVSGLPRA